MRRLQAALSQEALPASPLESRPSGEANGRPRDISVQHEILNKAFHTGTNIPAGGSDLCHPHNAAGPGAQNSFCKNFAGQRARR